MKNKCYNIAVLGHSRSGVGYIFNSVYKIMANYVPIKDYAKNYSLSESIKNIQNVYAVEVQFDFDKPNQVVLAYCANGFDHEKKLVEVDDFVKKSNIFFSHSNILSLYTNKLFPNLTHLIFCYRDCRDYIVSNIKYICLNGDEDASGYSKEKYSMIEQSLYYTSLGAFTKYNIIDLDMAQCTPILRHFSSEWRKYMLEYFALADKLKIFPVQFEQRYREPSDDTLDSIMLFLNVESGISKEINIASKEFGYVESKKVGKFIDFFSDDDYRLILNIAGDMLFCFDYISLNEYSEFLDMHDNFTLIFDKNIVFDISHINVMFQKFGKKIKEIIYCHPEEYLYQSNECYLLLSEANINIRKDITYDYYPYFKPYIEKQYVFFNISSLSVLRLEIMLNSSDLIDVVLCPSASDDYRYLRKFLINHQRVQIENVINEARKKKTVLLLSHNLDKLVEDIAILTNFYENILCPYPLFNLKQSSPFKGN